MSRYILLKYIIVLLLTFGLVASAGIILFSRSTVMMEESAASTGYSRLDNFRLETESRLREIDNILLQIGEDSSVITLAIEPSPKEKPQNLYKFLRHTEYINSFSISNEYIDNIYLHYRKSDITLTSNRIFLDSKLCYEDYFSYSDYTANEWNDFLYSDYYYHTIFPRQKSTVMGVADSRIFFVQSLPIAYPALQGAVVITVTEDAIIEPLRQIANEYDGYGFIMKDGDIIAATDNNVSVESLINSNKYVSAELTSSYNGWTYILQLSPQTMMKSVMRIRVTGYIVMGSALVMALLIIWIFGSKRANILHKLLVTLSYGQKNGAVNNELAFIASSVNYLITQNDTLVQTMESFQPIIISEFWSNLLMGRISTTESAQYYLMQMGPVELDGSFVVVVLRIHGLQDEMNFDMVAKMNQMKISVQNIVSSSVGSYIYSCDISPRTIAIICKAPHDKKNFDSILQKTTKDFYKAYAHRLSYFIGCEVNDLMDVYLSYNEAYSCIHYPAKNMLEAESTLRYPFQIPERAGFIRTLKNESFEVTKEYFDAFYKLSFCYIEKPHWMHIQFVNDLLAVAMQVYEDAGNNPSYPHERFQQLAEYITKSDMLEDKLDGLMLLFELHCTSASLYRTERGSPLIDKVIEFVSHNLYNYNLSLELVADHLNVSKAYLSSHFKERSGENFSSYIENLRIEKSCTLIESGKYTISEIAEAVGYGSAQVFRRAFKRIIGITPSEYNK